MAQQQDKYECRACGAQFNTREELERHNREKHPEMMHGAEQQHQQPQQPR